MASVQNYQSTASLYIGDLLPEINEANLYQKFSSIGPIVSIRICRDMLSRKSLGYGYINFQNPSDAEKAIDTMNYETIKGRTCRIMWCQRDPGLRKSGVGNIYIKNLDPEIENKELYDTFSNFGNILSCKIARDESGISKGYGFIHFETEQAAERAIEKVNCMKILDRKVFVGRFMCKKDRVSSNDYEDKYTNVFVKNFGEYFTDESMKKKFSEFGNVLSCIVMKDENKKSKGFGFVAFEKHESAKMAVSALNELALDNGNKLFVGKAQKKSDRLTELRMAYEKKKMERANKYHLINLYVKNLDDTVDDDVLKKEFQTYGTITSAKIMRDEKGVTKGFGFVCFSSPEEANKAVTEMHGKLFKTKPLYVVLAQTKEERRALLSAQVAQRFNAMRMHGGLPQMLPHGGNIYYPMPPQGRLFATPSIPPMHRNMNRIPMVGNVNSGIPSSRPMGPPISQSHFVGFPSMANNQQYVVPGRNQRSGPPNSNFVQHAQGQIRSQPTNVNVTQSAGGKVPLNGPVFINEKTPAAQINSNARNVQFGVNLGNQQVLQEKIERKAPDQSSKQIIGDMIFSAVSKKYSENPGKVTGMLLELPNEELNVLLNDQELLDSKINEAIMVLKSRAFSSKKQ